MTINATQADCIVIGGGFYGCCIALFLRACGLRATILESAAGLLSRASYGNQARVHQGYHYPRSLLTGLRSSANVGHFEQDFGDAVVGGFTKLYAIAADNSKVAAQQFALFCRSIGIPVAEAPRPHQALFDASRIEAVFTVTERAFDATRLRSLLWERLKHAEVPVQTRAPVRRIAQHPQGGVRVLFEDRSHMDAAHVFNCTYAQINTLLHDSGLPLLPFKHEIAELALVQPPTLLRNVGITLMDGPFFSTMPFPAENLHSLSHVRYTPHQAWSDVHEYHNPSALLRRAELQSHFMPMRKDAARYVPAIQDCLYIRSIYEVKTVLISNEDNDGRPILYRHNYGIPGLSVIMGGKIDNIYDILRAMLPVVRAWGVIGTKDEEALLRRALHG